MAKHTLVPNYTVTRGKNAGKTYAYRCSTCYRKWQSKPTGDCKGSPKFTGKPKPPAAPTAEAGTGSSPSTTVAASATESRIDSVLATRSQRSTAEKLAQKEQRYRDYALSDMLLRKADNNNERLLVLQSRNMPIRKKSLSGRTWRSAEREKQDPDMKYMEADS